MGLGNGTAITDRLAAYIGELAKVIGHADREGPLRDYCSGLLATEGRHSVQPMAAVTAPAQVSAQHQKPLHFVANATWSDELTLAEVRELVMPSIRRRGPIEAWIIDDTSFPKKGRHSVGVHLSLYATNQQRPHDKFVRHITIRGTKCYRISGSTPHRSFKKDQTTLLPSRQSWGLTGAASN
jgi:DDE superfamily endonuclease